jgi:hypothetical protein
VCVIKFGKVLVIQYDVRLSGLGAVFTIETSQSKLAWKLSTSSLSSVSSKNATLRDNSSLLD